MMTLKGENRIKAFKRIAETLASEICSREGVVGIVFIGGLARGFADKHSDMDILAFLDKRDRRLREQIKETGIHVQQRSRIDIDLEVHFLEDFMKWNWNEVDRWDFSHAKIVFDPHGAIQRQFRENLRVPRSFWLKRIVTCSEYLKWYCCPPKEGIGTMAEAWVERGDLVSAHYCVSYGIDLLASIVFALNKEFIPPQKWRLFYSYMLKWLPANYKKSVEEAMLIKSFSSTNFNRRLKALRTVWRETVPKIEKETGLTLDLTSKYYVEKVLHQS